MRRIARSPSGPNPRRLAAIGIVRRRRRSRFGRECRNVFRQIRGVACHALLQKYAESNENEDQRPRPRAHMAASWTN